MEDASQGYGTNDVIKELEQVNITEGRTKQKPTKIVSIRNGTINSSRRIERNKSGPQGNRMIRARAPPKRTQSQKIGRPAFIPTVLDGHQPQQLANLRTRGVNRSKSNRVKSTTSNVPSRSSSFHRQRVPDRTKSSSSLRRFSGSKRHSQHLISGSLATNTTKGDTTDDCSISDSVYTIATMDSIAVRKSQIPSATNHINGLKRIEFENGCNDCDDYTIEHEEELSVFSESWCSSEQSSSFEVLSDYEEGEMDGAILERDEDEDTRDMTPFI